MILFLFRAEKSKTVNLVKERMANIDALIDGLESDYSHLNYEISVLKDNKKNEIKNNEGKDDNYQDLRDFIFMYQTPEDLGEFVNQLWKDKEDIEEEMENEHQINLIEMRAMQK